MAQTQRTVSTSRTYITGEIERNRENSKVVFRWFLLRWPLFQFIVLQLQHLPVCSVCAGWRRRNLNSTSVIYLPQISTREMGRFRD